MGWYCLELGVGLQRSFPVLCFKDSMIQYPKSLKIKCFSSTFEVMLQPRRGSLGIRLTLNAFSWIRTTGKGKKPCLVMAPFHKTLWPRESEREREHAHVFCSNSCLFLAAKQWRKMVKRRESGFSRQGRIRVSLELLIESWERRQQPQ